MSETHMSSHGPLVRRLPPRPSSVAEARGMVRDLLDEAAHHDLLENAVLLVSEVVTNALLHAGTDIEVCVSYADHRLRVEVSDGSSHLPIRRRYATTAGTGRGMLMLEEFVDDWGVTRRKHGKTVWFELSAAARGERGDTVSRRGSTDGRRSLPGTHLDVVLLNLPLLLHAAWQEHVEALLREYLLARMDDESAERVIQVHAEATDAIAVLEEHMPRADVAMGTGRLMEHATEPRVTAPAVRVPIPLASVPHFETLNRTIEEALALVRDGVVLTPSTQPEIQAFRRWLCGQVVEQAAGRPPVPWSMETEPPVQPSLRLGWDASGVEGADTACVAADESSRMIAASPAAVRLLGYDDPAELVGERILSIIPDRYRQAHIAGFTLFLLVGRQPLIGTPVEVPVLCRDGSELAVELMIHVEPADEGHSVFVAELRPVDA